MTTMTTSLLFQLRIGRKRDVIAARQRARQLAALLGYSVAEQSRIASAVFELARQTREQIGRAILNFEVSADALRVVPHPVVSPCADPPPPLLRLEQPLPNGAGMATDDLTWVAQQLVRLTPVATFEEISRLNQELLRMCLELRACQARLAELTAPQFNPSAA